VATRLLSPPRLREVDPRAEPLLADFSCGGTRDYERVVDEVVEAFHGYHVPRQLQFTIAEDLDTGQLVGVCALHARELPGVALSAMYVGVIGINVAYRGGRLPDGSRIGDLLLADALARVDSAWIVVPPVWALIDWDNVPCRLLFERHGFTELPESGGDSVIVFRSGRIVT
jgi:hypothetical protein